MLWQVLVYLREVQLNVPAAARHMQSLMMVWQLVACAGYVVCTAWQPCGPLAIVQYAGFCARLQHSPDVRVVGCSSG
jgi:hypothetical protein